VVHNIARLIRGLAQHGVMALSASLGECQVLVVRARVR
jgi:hypothetical protein